MFNADEHYAGKAPERGTELCTIVESMWSLQVMIGTVLSAKEKTQKDWKLAAKLSDSIQKIYLNALFAALSEDYKTHPYLIFGNSMQAKRGIHHIYVFL